MLGCAKLRTIFGLQQKANWEPPQWNPPSLESLAKVLADKFDNYKARCPNCKALIRQKRLKYCGTCGHPFDKTPPPKLPRILSTHTEFYRKYINEPSVLKAHLRWECLECGNTDRQEWMVEDIADRRPFICILKCSKCHREMADVIIDPGLINKNKTWAIGLKAHGELRLSDYEPEKTKETGHPKKA
jgi:ribosomal protein S27AE